MTSCSHGTRTVANPYAHECDGPLCQPDQPVIECMTCDGHGHIAADA
ncbi:hypothetical protein ACFVWY_08950 [Streptomyces sp. NPDC058195]